VDNSDYNENTNTRLGTIRAGLLSDDDIRR